MGGQRLTEALVQETVERAFTRFRRLGSACRKGMIAEDEFRRGMSEAFSEGFLRFLEERRLALRVTGANYARFAEDWAACRKGALPASALPPWLYDRGERPAREAAAEDRRLFFILAEAFRLPPAFFEPLPEDVPAPGRDYVHGWREDVTWSVPFLCREDGGLLTDEAPVGKRFTLTDERGLKAALTVWEDRRQTDRSGMDFDELVCASGDGLRVRMAEFLAEGCIEGYTAGERRRKPEVLIRMDAHGRINRLAYWEGPEDREAFETFPLWQAYFRLAEEKRKRNEAVLSALFDTFRTPDGRG
jgi:hypothetical protein